ncbi:MAG: hypothetical protein HC817_15975 [Saprospiraceae bacterium]|nr:hypothetical protein [Saprospiraceae bacterium]
MNTIAHKNTAAFNDLELKGYLHSLIERANDRTQLLLFAEAVEEIFKNKDYTKKVEGWDTLSPQQQTVLALAIQESDDPQNLVPHDEVLKMMDVWLTE